MPLSSCSRLPLRLLLVEDNPDDADLILAELSLAGFDLEVVEYIPNELGT